ncbi:MAG TPA: hypothetical protein VMT43_06430 [Acidimicrobiales bacterium]|nr:hypothetical protein [Acidimicrobiales bacterium]
MSTPRLLSRLGAISPMRRRIAAGALVGSLALAIPSVAGAAAPQPDLRTTVSSIKATASSLGNSAVSSIAPRCESAITNRQTQIDVLDNRMAVAKWLSASHRSTLSGDLSSASSGLTTLNGQIQAATTLQQLGPLCRDIVDNFRIYVLRTPQVHLTIGGDAETSVVAKLQAIGPKLDAAIKAAQAKGEDVANAPSLYSDFNAKVADAASNSDGAADKVVGLTVADYNGGSAKPVLQTTYQNLVRGHGDLIAARQDAQQIVQILQSLH